MRHQLKQLFTIVLEVYNSMGIGNEPVCHLNDCSVLLAMS